MAEWTTKEVRFWVSVGGGRSPAARDALLCLFDEWLTGVKAQAWDEGHRHRWRRGSDDCRCDAWSSIECACGLYGTGELLSLGDNPYRTGTDHG